VTREAGERRTAAGQRAAQGPPVKDDHAWDAFLAGHPESTFYHTRIWARILAGAFPGIEDASRWIDIGTARAALPLHGWRRLGGILTTRHSSFPFLYGGPIPRRAGGCDLLPEILADLARGGSSLLLVSNPFGIPAPDEVPPPAAACEVPPGVSVERDSTHILCLPERFEAFWDDVLTTAKRNDVRRLAKKGVAIRTGTGTEEISALYRFYRQSFGRWGGRPGFVYPEDLYRAMIELGEGNVRLYLAEHEGRIVGGAFIVRWNGHVHYHAGYFDHGARSLRPNVLLQEKIIRDAIEDGYRDYDFLPSGGNAGVESFKEGFGGVRVPIERYHYRAPLHRLLARFR
jgi:hypothetical protein